MTPARRLAAGTTVVLATHNRGKIAEFQGLLAQAPLSVRQASALGLEAPEESAADFAGNAALKALAAARASGLPALADDSGFGIAAIDGAPGVWSARWVAELGSPEAAMQRVRDRAIGDPDRRAWFVCALALAWPDGVVAGVEGRVDGIWIWPPRGMGGFGYDPMFLPDGLDRTFAEMSPVEKDAISHRARAWARLAEMWLP